MAGIIALYGSGEFTPAMVDVDTSLLGLTKAPAVCILPTAAGLESDHTKWIEDGIRYYQSLGVEVNGLELVHEKDANNPKIVKELEKYTYFVFSGGDPGHLLDTLKESYAWQKLRELHDLGATLVGSSAGAMVFGKMCWARVYDMEKDGIMRPWEEGLGLIDFGVIPHFDTFIQKLKSDEKQLVFDNFPKGTKIVGIDEDTAYVKKEADWVKKGKGKVYDPIKATDV